NLVNLSSQSNNPNGTGLPEIGSHVVAMLRYYDERKHQIPSSSYWFGRTYKHKDWLISSYTEVGIALATATSLQPDAVPDHLWFEESLARILGRALSGLSELNNRAAMIGVLNHLHGAINVLGRAFAIEEALRIIRALHEALAKQWRQIADSDDAN